jgi:hypothetical protein
VNKGIAAEEKILPRRGDFFAPDVGGIEKGSLGH